MENSKIAEDLQFMRSMIERTQRQIDPLSPVMMAWGIICLVGYPVSYWLIRQGKFSEINSLWLILWAIGFTLTGFFVYRLVKRESIRGVRSYIFEQICWVWVILGTNGVIWSMLGIFRNPFFLWAALYAIGLSMMGILYTKEWLIAGICVFAAIVASVSMKSYALIILGVVMGLGCIIPGLIAQKRLCKWKAEDVQN